MMDPQIHFDELVKTAEAWFRADGFGPEERALAEQLEAARTRDSGVASAAIEVAWSKLAPPDLSWNSRGGE